MPTKYALLTIKRAAGCAAGLNDESKKQNQLHFNTIHKTCDTQTSSS